MKTILITLQLFSSIIFGQYSEEWRISQDQNEKGILYFDLNEDGYADLTKTYWNTVTIYDGANDYSVLWAIEEENTENLAIWDLYDFNGNGEKLVILTSSNFYNSVDFRLKGYEKYGDTPLWGTESYDGSLSFLSVGEMDQTSGKEIVFGIYRYDDVDSAYYHTIKILNGQTGVEEWSSTEESGYLAGPYLGDLDGDETSEILLNIYDYKNENYYLSVLSLTSSVRVYENELKPQAFSISQNYPNPFNPNTILPIHLNAQSQLSISIVNIQGHIVQTLVNGNFASGKYQFSWNGKSQSGESQSSGVYFFLIDINGNQIKRPMVLMK